MSSLEIRVEPLQGVAKAAIVHLDGVLDQPTLNSFLAELERVRKAGNIRVLLDMEHVSYANSTALGALVTQADEFHEAGGEMAIFKPQPKVELVIEMLGLAQLFKVFTTFEEAHAYIASVSGGTAEGAGAPTAEGEERAAAAPAARAPAQQAGAAAPAERGTVFPLRAECLGCGVLLEFTQPSHFRCPRCGAVYSADASGRVAGSKPRGGQPLELTLTCHPQTLRAFQRFIGELPAWQGFTEIERTQLESAIGEVCGAIHQKAYGGDANATFHVLVVSRPSELALRIADHGTPLDPSAFPLASGYMSEFEHRPHPTRGNVLKMTKRAV
jgi:anti-anti-sigma factor